jgi:hypothetical protein
MTGDGHFLQMAGDGRLLPHKLIFSVTAGSHEVQRVLKALPDLVEMLLASDS